MNAAVLTQNASKHVFHTRLPSFSAFWVFKQKQSVADFTALSEKTPTEQEHEAQSAPVAAS